MEGAGDGAGHRPNGSASAADAEAKDVQLTLHRIRLQEQASADKSLQAADQGRAGGRSEAGDVDSAAAAAAEKLQLQDKASRLPRWTRRETLVLVEAKKAGELRVKKNKEERQQKDSGGSPKSKPVSESKWIYISSFCKQRGVDREANQCRKRWGNLFGDYKRIRDWQKRCSLGDGSGGEDGESFWLMRNDARKENKLPGSFDPEVFEALESFLGRKTSTAIVLAAPEAVAVVFESGRPASDEGLFSDIEHPAQEEDVTPDAAIGAGSSTPDPDSYKEQSPTHSNGRKKRKRPFVEPEQQKDQLVALLENNCKVLSDHIEAQNRNNELDRAQRKQQADSLVSVLGKLADALEIISAKLQKG